MTVVNLKQILPNDNQVTVTDKINFNFDQILTCGGGPPGDPGLKGNRGLPGGQGIKGNTGDDGIDGNRWYIGFGTPPVQPDPPIYNEGDLFLSTSDNYIWEFGANFWSKTITQLKVAGGEFKTDTATNTAVILQNASKNLVISSIDYDGASLNPNSSAFDSKFKIVAPAGYFLEFGLDIGGAEDQSKHVTIELDTENNLNINNNGGGFLIQGTEDISIISSESINLNSKVLIGQTSGQYTGTIINETDLVNKYYVDTIGTNASIIGDGLSGNAYNIVRINGSSPYKAEATDIISVTNTKVTVNPTGAITQEKLDVTGVIKAEGFSGGNWDKTQTANYQRIGDRLEIWGYFEKTITNNSPISIEIPYPINFGVNNRPAVNITVSVDEGDTIWGIKDLDNGTSNTTFKLFNTQLGISYPSSRTIKIHWHAIGGWKNRSEPINFEISSQDPLYTP